MEQSGFIVGVDLGTSKIVGLLGRRNEQGVISILASEIIPSDGCIKNGVVYNIDEAAGKIKKLISLLENKSGKKIGKIYVSVAGRSLRAVEHTVTKALDSQTDVTFIMLDQMEQQARQNKPDFLTNYSVVSPEIFLDGRLEEDAIDKPASLIEGRYRLIVGRPNIKSNLVRCVTDKNQLDVAGFVVGAVAAGAIVLDEEDKNAGCALVDFGAGTTTVSIYKDGLLRYMSVIPFGGRSITRDIQALGFIDSAAENYKIKYGRVGKDKTRSAVSPNVDVDLKELNRVIQLRVEEIVLNIINQIRESGYTDKLDAGIVIIGGASQMQGLPEYLEDKAKLSVKKGAVKRLYINNAADLLQNPSLTQALGLLLFATENCEKQDSARILRSERSDYMQPVEEVKVERKTEQPQTQSRNTTVAEPKVEEKEESNSAKADEHASGRNRPKNKSGLGIFGKLQNLGGALFKDED